MMLSFRLPCFQENWCLPSGQHQRGEESSENYLHCLLGSSGLLKYTGVSANLFHWFDFSVQNNVCVCVWVCSCVHARMFACKCSCGSQRLMTGVFLNHFPLYVLGWVFCFVFFLLSCTVWIILCIYTMPSGYSAPTPSSLLPILINPSSFLAIYSQMHDLWLGFVTHLV